MSKEQFLKVLKLAIIITAIMLVFEIVFSINAVNDFFGKLITGANGWVVYLIIWAIMFLQTTVLNIPAYVVLSACASIGLKTLSWEYFLTVISAYMVGCLVAYWIGRKFGAKAVKWCAGSEEDYKKWSEFLNTKGKWWYVATVVFPMFPDDLLCLVAGGVKFNFWFYTVANFVGRSVGLITMLLVLELIGLAGGGFPFMIIVWGVALLVEIGLYIWKRRSYDKNSNNNIQ